MGDRTRLTKALATTGTILLLLPLLALTSLGSAPRVGLFPLLAFAAMELSPAVLLGGCLLLFAAVRARSHVWPIAWGLGLCASVSATAIILISVTSARALTEMSWYSWYLALGATTFWIGAILACGSGLSMLRALYPTTRSPARG